VKQSNTIQTALQNRERLKGEIVGLQKQLQESGSRLARLEDVGDLADKAAIGQIVELQAVVALLPRRISGREGALAQATTELLAACHAEIQSQLGPRGRELENAARSKLRAALAPHFADEGELQRAIEASALVRKILGVRAMISIRTAPVRCGAVSPGEPEEIVGYAEELLAAARRLEAFAKEVS
jgi:hypothetical protein